MLQGRDAELNYLENYYNKPNSQIVVVYGPKGIGKTRLLKEFAYNKSYFYYNCRACSLREQLYLIGREYSQKEGSSLKDEYLSIEEIFNLICPDNKTKKIIIFDEFHNIIKSDSEFLDTVCKIIKNKNIFLILSSSASGWIENSMVKKLGPSALNINGLLKIRELKYKDINNIYSSYFKEDSIKNFSILGGICGLWDCFSMNLSFEDNIIRNVLSKNSKLFSLMDIYLYEELREPAVYSTILASLAKGICKLNDIYKHTGFSRAKISVYLKNLMELDMVEKVYSFDTPGYSDTQKGVYRITNPYVKFYFKYIYPNYSDLEFMTSEEFYNKYIRDSIDYFIEETYIKICQQAFIAAYSNAGQWLGKSGSIDIVSKNKAGKYLVANCSFNKQCTVEDLEWLKFCTKKAKIENPIFYLFSQAGFTDELIQISQSGEVILKNI